jgi:hypothetical protein
MWHLLKTGQNIDKAPWAFNSFAGVSTCIMWPAAPNMLRCVGVKQLPTNQPINQLINPSMNQSISQSINQSLRPWICIPTFLSPFSILSFFLLNLYVLSIILARRPLDSATEICLRDNTVHAPRQGLWPARAMWFHQSSCLLHSARPIILSVCDSGELLWGSLGESVPLVEYSIMNILRARVV